MVDKSDAFILPETEVGKCSSRLKNIAQHGYDTLNILACHVQWVVPDFSVPPCVTVNGMYKATLLHSNV
jgi:hypothetical protein